MTRIEEVLTERGGIARRGDLVRARVGRRHLEQSIAAGRVIRLRKGVYALPGVASDIVTAARHGGELACGDALKAQGVWLLEDPTEAPAPAPAPHVWVGPSNREHAHTGCRCRVHHEQEDRTASFGIVPIVLALLQYFACAVEERCFASLESALNLGLLGIRGLAELRRRLPARQRWIVDLARVDAESGLESLLRFRLHLLGIGLRSQVMIDGVGRVDFLLGGRLILEVDGRLNHDGASKRHKDLMRDAAAAAQGYVTLRFDYAMIIFDWPVVLAAILGRLQAMEPSIVQDDVSVLQDQ
ncbi:DUF559 domain-containing protein [Microbacterium tumbae]